MTGPFHCQECGLAAELAQALDTLLTAAATALDFDPYAEGDLSTMLRKLTSEDSS